MTTNGTTENDWVFDISGAEWSAFRQEVESLAGNSEIQAMLTGIVSLQQSQRFLKKVKEATALVPEGALDDGLKSSGLDYVADQIKSADLIKAAEATKKWFPC